MKSKYKLVDLLKVAELKESTYHYHNKQLDKDDKYADLKNEISSISNNNVCYGYRRVYQELFNRGRKINRKTVYRLMKELKLVGKAKVKANVANYNRGNESHIFSNIMNGYFYASSPNEKWVTDVTEFKVSGKKIYLSPILDLYNSEIVSFSISDKNNFVLILDMLNVAFKKVSNTSGLILHSDQGVLYKAKHYHDILEENEIIGSMSRKGNCYDNAVIENFFGILKREMFNNKKFESVDDFISKLNIYISYYNNKRIKTKLGMSPVKYRTHNLIA